MESPRTSGPTWAYVLCSVLALAVCVGIAQMGSSAPQESGEPPDRFVAFSMEAASAEAEPMTALPSAGRSDNNYGIRGPSPDSLDGILGAHAATPGVAGSARGGDTIGFGNLRGTGRGGAVQGKARSGVPGSSPHAKLSDNHYGIRGPSSDSLADLLSGALTDNPMAVASAGGGGALRGGMGAPPQSGVLASTFVGGGGISARLDDLLDRGVVVDGERIRLTAFEDRGPLPYPVPAREAVALHADVERSRVDAFGDRVHLQIALVARRGEAPVRPRMDVRLVLDRSGSMSGEKWQNAVAAAHAIVDRLAPDDRLGVVSYADEARLDLRPARLGNRRAAHAAIDSLRPGGSTNIGEALDVVGRHAPRRQAPSDVGLVLLVSDGCVTVGEAAASVLGGKARALFDRDGTITTAIGLGSDFDEETMLSIAREGGGSYHFVRRPADVESILADELESRAQAVAQALRVKIVPAPGAIVRKVYGSRLLSDAEHAAVRTTEIATDARLARELGISRDRRTEDEEGLRIHLPSFRRGDQHVVLVEMDVPGGAGTAGVATVTLDYKDLAVGENVSVRRSATAERTSDRAAVAGSVNRIVKRTVLAFQAGEALQEAAWALARGSHDDARRILSERQELLRAASDVWRDPALARDAALLARWESVVASAYPSWGGGEQRTLSLAMGAWADRRMR